MDDRPNTSHRFLVLGSRRLLKTIELAKSNKYLNNRINEFVINQGRSGYFYILFYFRMLLLIFSIKVFKLLTVIRCFFKFLFLFLVHC